ncbi:hypothetical protein RMSM_03389 [Rhodopirellula maiorica SM1]|uniref:Uncharacterized protein n=1 Tax=Rhodopirellula maiorica SM1 TaxID=1265738 RepID=M5S0N5_9BACT|nr:hypothetical protein RMSM_03389 [Rhodopirellula maiorica SM1]
MGEGRGNGGLEAELRYYRGLDPAEESKCGWQNARIAKQKRRGGITSPAAFLLFFGDSARC